MKSEDVNKHFGSQSATARALGLKSASSVCTWGEYPPPLRQLQIEGLTDGDLKAEPECDKFRVAA